MQHYQLLKARMKGQAPSNWSPASKKRSGEIQPATDHFGSGLTVVPIPPSQDDPPVNQTIYQSFEWYTPSWSTPITVPESATISHIVDPQTTTVTKTRRASQPSSIPSHYSVLKSLLPSLAALGITSMWLPPGCKASNPQDNGYGIYDLYDLGEFDWKQSRATKWGDKEQLLQLGKKAEEVGVALYWDAVLNHRASADGKERTRAVKTNSRDRTKEAANPQDVTTWTRFDYPARKGRYSDMTYNWRHFSGIDWDDTTRTKAIYRFTGDEHTTKSGWALDVDDELGNYDYLMFADVDYSQADVQQDVLNWATWLPTQVPGLRGLRLDAIKHYSARFQYQLIKHMRTNLTTADWFFVGEYWRADSKFLARHIDRFAGHLHLFDVKLVYNFSDFSSGRILDLRKIFQDSLVELKPDHAVTFTTNHDTQATQSLAAPIQPWFLLHAYSLILLRQAGRPVIFHGDVFGTLGPSPTTPSSIHGHRLMRLSLVRKLYAYGPQHEFPASATCMGWTREGHNSHSAGNGVAVVLNTAWKWAALNMYVGQKHAGQTWVDVIGGSWDRVVIGKNGWAIFRVGMRAVAVFVNADADGRDLVEACSWPGASRSGDEDD